MALRFFGKNFEFFEFISKYKEQEKISHIEPSVRGHQGTKKIRRSSRRKDAEKDKKKLTTEYTE